jgi:hypothetical protein
MCKEFLFSLLSLLLFQTTSTAQEYVSGKSLINVALKTEQCDIKAESEALELTTDASTGDFHFRIMVVSFQSKASAGTTATTDCWSKDKYKRISFRGRLDNYEILQSKKDGSYPLMLKGELIILGQVFPISESIAVQIEKGKINLSFNTALKSDNWSMDLDLTTTIGEAIINE